MSRIISPLARVQIGNDTFFSGDGFLQSVSVELAEDAKSSRCSFSLYDKGLRLGAKFQAISFAQGGIAVPEGLLADKQQTPAISNTPTNPTTPGATASASGGTARNLSLSPEERAFLDLIAYAEGTQGHGDDGYNVIVGYKYFSSYAKHPDIYVRAADSTAAGRYQFLDSTWAGLRKKLNLKDFSPNSQDLGAIELIREAEALEDVKKGSAGLEAALYKCRRIWASFPASPYNQPRRNLSELKNEYVRALLKYQRQTPTQQAAATQPQIVDKATTKPLEVKDKGCEIIVEMGYGLEQMVAFHFWHVGTTTSRNQLDTTVFEGQSIRWTMARRIQNTAYTSITLRQLAQMLCTSYGLRLDMEGNGPTYQYLDQTGISDYELLLREAKAIGYSITESGNTLIIKPLRPNFTGFVLTRDILQSIQFSDRASADRASKPGTTVSNPSVPAADSKLGSERKTGRPVQTRVEDSTGTGTKTKTAITGSPIPAIHGTTIPDTSVTGLPKQEIGSIDLADGKAEAQVIQDEARRVKGYESQATLVTTPEILTLAPGSIIAIDSSVAPDPFNREFRVANVRHTLSTSGMRTEIQMYSPQAAKTQTNTPATDTPAPTTTELKPGGFIVPCAGRTGDGLGAGRSHHGIDIANDQGTPIVASCDGIVYKTQAGCTVGNQRCHRGYGNNVVLQHANGYYTRYAHLHEITVTQGQQVKQGQQVGTMGNTGHSTGPHLHWEIRQGHSFGKATAPSEVGCKVPGEYRTGSRY